ncbi:hypothetical protein DL89DRAFT_267787 [Linderina pennispora]|uniref:F-box domain-containing protein n=1 Tax=Linderina pennispora TaxID=61395 RepID=A0A1Y1W889_9FUNG|nr:uncharacterized protein DL89DRAFT_267787 [Linderina pennispora]ORX69605.1 hypothetical protein DL89DRAFT_267787 [Linderina pennispora]
MEAIAQHPPLLIFEHIIHYLLPEFLNDSYDKEAIYDVSKPLTRVCRSWRQFFLSYAFRYVHVGTQFKPSLKLAYALGTCDLTKEVIVMFKTATIFNGSALIQLRQCTPAETLFPHIEVLSFTFTGKLGKLKQDDKLQPIHIFTDELMHIFPDISSVKVTRDGEASQYWSPFHSHKLLERLLTGRSAIDCTGYILNAVLPFSQSSTPLQSLVTSGSIKTKQVFTFIRRNWQSLQWLDLDLSAPNLVEHIVSNSDGTTVTYPELHKLRLKTCEQDATTASRPSFDGMPFPALKSLVVHGIYPFSDDTLLRGSGDSMEFLDMCMSESDIDMFIEAGILDEGRFKALQCARLGELFEWPSQVYGNRVSRILGAFHRTPVIDLSDGFNFNYSVLQSRVDSFAPTLRVLDIPGVRCTYEQILELIGSLPLIHKLDVTCAKSVDLGDANYDTELMELADKERLVSWDAKSHFGCVYLDMNTRPIAGASGPPLSLTLKEFHLRVDRGAGWLQAVRLAVILALRCPSILSFPKFFANGVTLFRSHLVEMGPFVQLADYLSRDRT